MLEAVQSGNQEKTARYTQSLAALGSEALPEIRKRLAQPNLPIPVHAAYATALLETGGDPVLPEIAALWKAHPALKSSLLLTLVRHRSPQVGQTLLDLWLDEPDPQLQKLLAQALTSNPIINAKVLAEAQDRERDPGRKSRLQSLSFEMTAQGDQQDEAVRLMALPLAEPATLAALKEVLERPGIANKGVALSLLGKQGSPEALSALLAYAQAQKDDQGLRYQALAAFCPKAGAEGVRELSSWYPQAPPEVRFDLLNAVGQSGNLLFLPFTESLGKEGKRAWDLLDIARNRRNFGIHP